MVAGEALNKSAIPSPMPSPRVRFLDLSVTDPAERAALMAAFTRVLDHGRMVLGQEVDAFEQQVAAYCGRRYAIGMGTGTDALILGLKALDIGPGDEVITTPLSWLATASAILINGATPVFADIDETLNIDPVTIEPLITARTKAILPVHFTGRLARMPEIMAIAKRHRLLVIEDGAQAFGARYLGQACGSFGDMACLSMNAMKVLAALGDGGMVLTDDADVARRLDRLRHSGVVERDYCQELSHNCRLDSLQAAFLQVRLERLPGIIARRRHLADRYNRELESVITTPPRLSGLDSVYYTYPVRTIWRDELRAHLERHGIETRIQHPLIMNDQPAFRGKVRGASPRASELVKQILCLPLHEKLTDDQQGFVIDTVTAFISDKTARPRG